MSESNDSLLGGLVHQLDRAVAAGSSKEETVQEIKRVVTEALHRKEWLPERCLASSPDCYARHLVYKDPADRFAIVAMVWGPGQATLIHDHGGVWCVEGVYRGRVRVTRYEMEGPAPDRTVRFNECDTILAGIGETGALIPPVDHHRIDNPYDADAVTLHTYGCDLKSCQVFVPLEGGKYEVRTKPLGYTSVPSAVPRAVRP